MQIILRFVAGNGAEYRCPLVQRSLTPCTETPCSLRLAKGGGGECDNKGRKAWGRERGLGDEGTKKSKTNVISAAAERKQCLFTW